MPGRTVRTALLAAMLAAAAVSVPAGAAPRYAPHVVVATIDTGTNPFHPTWRRASAAHPSTYIPGYPASAKAAKLRFLPELADSVERSRAELAKFGPGLTWIPGTNIVGAWAHPSDRLPVFDWAYGESHSHGARASSQIAGKGFGLAPDAYLVVMDRTADGGTDLSTSNAEALRWAADQPWIDIIHTNIGDPIPLNHPDGQPWPNFPEAVAYAVSKGKLVVAAGGNYYAEPTEVSAHAGPQGALVVGANDNCGYSEYSSLDPHVVMDGMGTAAAAPDGYGQAEFSGTSSASPRTTGYVADLLLRLRRAYGYTGGVTKDGALLTVPPAKRPKSGPLSDGRLTAAELHEVVRKTANPRSHASKWDGTQGTPCIREVPAGPSLYPKMGYGEVSEHTAGAAYDVATGRAPMPSRPDEDRFYEASEEARRRFWS